MSEKVSENEEISANVVVEAKRHKGRPFGAVAKTTRESRKAIALFVDQNLPRLDNWLQQVANGLPKVDAEGKPIRDNQGSVVYVVKPDPVAAIKCVTDIAEYHLPKLSRSEQSAVVRVEQGELDVSTMNLADLKRYVLRQAGIDATELNTLIDIDAESTLVPVEAVPDWLEPK